MKHHARILSLVAVLLFYPFTAFALSTDRDKPINIEADHVDINKQKENKDDLSRIGETGILINKKQA